jgi:hypothetical protein
MQDVGLACLSPGFLTQDPAMREQLQRSVAVRDQQRHIIELRLQQSAKPGDGDSAKAGTAAADGGPGPGLGPGLKTASSTRRKPPPGLSIVAPPHEQFANERVIQSAPLHQSFPERHQPEPLTRHVANQPSSNLATTSHIHHVPATQTSNRLPPINDVLGVHRDNNSANNNGNNRTSYFQSGGSNANSAHSASRPTFPSPGHPPPQPPPPSSSSQQQQQQQAQSHHPHRHHHHHHHPHQQQQQAAAAAPLSAGRPREYRSAEEAVASLSGGREDLLPKIIHYSGHQPPTPPSPLTAATGGGPPPSLPHKLAHSYSSGDMPRNSRRRTRVEYELDNGSPPLGSGPDTRRALFGNSIGSGGLGGGGGGGGGSGNSRDSPDTQHKKKDEFLALCARAWDLFHS